MIAAGIASFVMVALKAFQQLNVMHDQRAWVVPTSFGMAACECVVVVTYARHGFDVWLVATTGLGAAAGCLLSMMVHKWLRNRRGVGMAGDPRFHAFLKQIGELHDKKQADYGADGDPLANVRASQEWGVPPWVGALVRLNDKVHRLKRFAQRGALANESAEDSMMDIAVYALIALVLYRETREDAALRKLA